MSSKKTLVIGASPKTERYSYKAATKLQSYGHEVIALGLREGKIGSIDIITEKKSIENLHSVTLYVSAKNQGSYIDYLFSLQPKRVIFNPGTENPELYPLLASKGIEWEEACTLVMLSIGNY